MISRNIPNAITFIRLLLIAPFMYLLLNGDYQYALYFFMFAGLSDGLDGLLARHFHWQSQLGSFIDPMADKFLITFSFIALTWLQAIPLWLFILVFMRDATLSVGLIIWHVSIKQKMKYQPTIISKLTTLFQLLLVTVCLFELAFFSLPAIAKQLIIAMTALTTFVSYVDYTWTWGRRIVLLRRHKQ